jgi:hypothetical protein
MIQTRVVFHNETTESHFGIAEMKAEEVPSSPMPHHFILAIDRSGSMALKERDGMTKMEHVQHTLRNMLRYMASLDTQIFVSVVAFDDRVDRLAERKEVSDQTLADLTKTCDSIVPLNRTDIGAALSEMDWIRQGDLGTNATCILLTDGCPTVGVDDAVELEGMVPKDCEVAFVSYGTDHNARLMEALSKGRNAENYFVDSAENAGSVYGEILHGALFLAGTDIEISVTGCKIYDWRNDEWRSSLDIPKIPGGVTKIYHLMSKVGPPGDSGWAVISAPRKVAIKMVGRGGEETLHEVPAPEHTTDDLSKFILRQKVLETMAEAGKLGNNEKTRTAIQELESELRAHLELSPSDSAFIENLIDDLYITDQSMETEIGEMFRLARRTSQGDQRAYNVRNIDALVGRHEPADGPIPLRRAGAANGGRRVSQADHSPYAGASQIGLMRQCSAPL